ncbi:MAG: hypothetical protein V4773_03650 [Verrucomicrobiota bacterium]
MTDPHARDTSGRARTLRAGQNAAALVAAKLAAGVCALLQVPILLGHVGAENFGWMTVILSLLALIPLADLGVAMALQHALAENWSRRDAASLHVTYRTGQYILRWHALAVLALGLLLTATAPTLGFVAPASISPLEHRLALLIVTASTALGVYLSTAGRLADAIQAGWINAVWNAVAAVVTLAGLAAAAASGASPTLCVALLCGQQLLPPFCARLQVRRRLGWKTSPARTDARPLWRAGLRFAPMHLSGALMYTAAPALFARFGGYEASAAYGVLQRLFGVFTQVLQLALGPLWPAYVEARAQGDATWTRRTFFRSLALAGLASAALLGVVLARDLVFKVWLHTTLPLDAALAWWLGVHTALSLFTIAFSQFLLGHNRLQCAAPAISVGQFACLPAMLVLGTLFAAPGVAAALCSTVALVTLPALLWQTRAALARP